MIDELDVANKSATFTANESYWGGESEFATLTPTGFADENGAALAFRTGEIDLIFAGDIRSLEAAADTAVTTTPGTAQALFWMNSTVAPWDDVHVRRAVAYTLNKEEIINVSGASGEPVSTLIPPTQMLPVASEQVVEELIGSLPSFETDIDKAKEELAQSAHPDGFDAELTTPSFGGFAESAQAIEGQLQAIGINLTVTVVSDAEYLTMFSKPHTDTPIQFSTFNNLSPDIGAMPRVTLSSSATAVGKNNFADYVNPQVDELVLAGDATTDPAEQFAIYSDILRIIAEDVPYVPIYAGNKSVALADGFEWSTFGAYYVGHTPYITEITAK